MAETQVVVMGLGYIGLPTAALIAAKGMDVLGVDVNREVVNIVNRGEIHIVEPDLKGLAKYAVENRKLRARTKPGPADVYIIAVPTPFKENHEPDTSFVENAVQMILPHLSAGNLVIIESTCPLGTTDVVKDLIFAGAPKLRQKIHLAYCPERVLPGRILYELEHNDRIVGGKDRRSCQKAAGFYRRFVRGDIFQTNARTAEMCKLVENAYRDVNIAFANELSIICHEAEVDVAELVSLANRHPRVNILQYGPGVGGHCISIDPWFLVSRFKDNARLIRTGREINSAKPLWVVDRIQQEAEKHAAVKGSKPAIACLGLAFKPDIDDLRESPSLYIAEQLMEAGYRVLPVEPNIKSHDKLDLVPLADALKGADIIAVLVAHREFLELDIPDKLVLDFCGALGRKT